MEVKFLDLRAAYLELKSEIDQAIARVLDSGWYILGSEVDAFEKSFADYCGADAAIGVANGLDALHLALLAMGVKAGDEVIVPSNTYIATWLAVTQCGAIPVPVEPGPDTHNIDPARVERAITAKTRVILPVHLYGFPADLDPIISLARKYGLRVLEDAAQAHGAKYKGKRIGAHGDAVAWSFYPGKNLGAMGDGGAVTTNDSRIAERVRLLRNYGSRLKYVNDICGFNSRLDPVQAAILNIKLKYLDEWNARRCRSAEAYISLLSNSSLALPKVPEWAESAWHLFVVRAGDREDLAARLAESGVGTMIHYPIPPFLQKAYEHLALSVDDYPLAGQYAREVLSLPMGPHLKEEEIEYICNIVKSV